MADNTQKDLKRIEESAKRIGGHIKKKGDKALGLLVKGFADVLENLANVAEAYDTKKEKTSSKK